MKIVVLVKSAVDEAELRADQAGHPVLKGAALKVSNFDRVGVEEALLLKERHGGAVTVVTLGGPDSRKAVKEAMAMGCDGGVLVLAEPGVEPDTLGTAYCLAAAIRKLGDVDVVICSEGASDTYQAQTGAMLAEFLGVPFLAYAKGVEIGDGKVRCDQAFETATYRSEASLPAVVSMVNGANRPRYPTLLQVMAAAKKTIEDVPIASLRDAGYPDTGTDVLDVVLQKVDRKRVILDGTPEDAAGKLVEALKQEGVI